MSGLPGAALARRTAWALAASTLVPNRRRGALLRRLGLTGMDRPFVCAGVAFSDPAAVTAGPGCFLNAQVFLDSGAIRLGRNVYLGPRAMLLTSTHEIGDHDRRAGEPVHRGIEVGDGTWIGAGAVVLPGVRIGAGCVIGAGAVVTADCAPDGVYVGVPARRVRSLPDS
ncbi:acyltransferase [Brachybacterium sp. AOP25-B2-12]|uniref:acyltransferase n=1 Tax=Brachybacterium sp. AOP25-B2-12 TaxID=3457710 RepID=UPI00403393D8